MLHAPAEAFVRDRVLARNVPCRLFFEREAERLARACAEMASRFARGGRLLAFGHGAYATDAMHLSVEFIHPVIVGKRALPALDVSMAPEAFVAALAGEDDMVLALGPPGGDPACMESITRASRRNAMTIAWPGGMHDADYAVEAPSADVHLHQELFELLGHTMYESVHVFLEHLSADYAADSISSGGDFDFLYPFLEQRSTSPDALAEEVCASIRMKCADANELRERVAREECEAIAAAVRAIQGRLREGGRILAFGNGGSATDATDFVMDCVMPECAWDPIPAISLALEPAVLTATANDVGVDVMFLRQLIAQSSPKDVAFAFSTSGGSRNVVAALEEARKRGLLTIALLGYDGGEIVRRHLADVAIVVRSDYVPRIQEAQGDGLSCAARGACACLNYSELQHARTRRRCARISSGGEKHSSNTTWSATPRP